MSFAVCVGITAINSHVAPHTSHLTPHISHLTPRTSHLTPHTSHLTPHTSHLSPHTSHITARLFFCQTKSRSSSSSSLQQQIFRFSLHHDRRTPRALSKPHVLIHLRRQARARSAKKLCNQAKKQQQQLLQYQQQQHHQHQHSRSIQRKQMVAQHIQRLQV